MNCVCGTCHSMTKYPDTQAPKDVRHVSRVGRGNAVSRGNTQSQRPIPKEGDRHSGRTTRHSGFGFPWVFRCFVIRRSWRSFIPCCLSQVALTERHSSQSPFGLASSAATPSPALAPLPRLWRTSRSTSDSRVRPATGSGSERLRPPSLETTFDCRMEGEAVPTTPGSSLPPSGPFSPDLSI